MKRSKEYWETTHQRVYKIWHKRRYASCVYCNWHPSMESLFCDNDKWERFMFEERAGLPDVLKNHPNWKLVSKNRKQWMKKKFIKQYRDYVGNLTKDSGFFSW